MMIFAGTLQVLFGAVLVYGFYIVGLGLDARRDRGAGPSARRRILSTLVAPGLGLGLAGIVLLPGLAHLPHTARALGMTYAFGSMGSVPPMQLASSFFAPATSLLGATPDFEATSFYVGALSLPLAVVALAGSRRRLPLALATCAGALAILAMGKYGGLHPLLYAWLPDAVGMLRGMGRALGPGTVCIALLVALGLERLGNPNFRLQRLFGVLLVAAALVHALLLWLAPPQFDAAGLGGVLVLAAAFALWCLRERFPRLLQPGLALLIALDLVAFGPLDAALREAPPPPSQAQIAGSMPVLADLESGPSADERMLLLGFGPRNLPLLLGPDGVGGYNPLVTLRYLDFVSLVQTGRRFAREPLDRFVHFDQPQRLEAGLIDAAAIRFVVSPARLAFDGLELRKEYPKHPLRKYRPYLYENEQALPRAYLAYRTRPATDPAQLERLLAAGFDARRTTVVESDSEPLAGPEAIEPVEILRERPEVLRFDVATEHPAVLVVANAWYPGWRAWVDGEETPVLRVNWMFRGVELAPGAHRVEMRFEPQSFRVGAFVSLAALVVLALLLLRRGPPA